METHRAIERAVPAGQRAACDPPKPLRDVIGRSRLRAARTSDRDYDDWLTDVVVRTEPFFTWLGVVFALVIGAQLVLPPGAPAAGPLGVTSTVLWLVFLTDFGAKFVVAPRKLRFLRCQWLQLIALVAPLLRVLNFLRLARLGRALPATRIASASYRSAGTAKRLLRSRVAYLAGLSSIAVVALGELAYAVDGGPNHEMHSLADALLWSGGTVIGMSPTFTPHDRLAQLLMVAGFAVGIVVVTALAGTLGSFLLDARRELATQEDDPYPAEPQRSSSATSASRRTPTAMQRSSTSKPG